jgi:tRNA (guanine-N7-)-methyltransferase
VAKRKLQKFSELRAFPNVLQPLEEEYLSDHYKFKGKWAGDFFGNNNPVILELGCGKGEYALCLARKNPNINFIGIDIKGERLWRGGKTALDEKLDNIGFLRVRIETISSFFSPNEVSEIWITFPDPQPNKPKIKKRLTSPPFLTRYKSFLKTDGHIHLKTDNAGLFDYTLETIAEENHQLICKTHDLYNSTITGDVLLTQTHYESLYLAQGLPICYLKFMLS